jgi:hypothetical protein
MWKKIAVGVFLLGILCVATGFALAVAQRGFGASKDAIRHVALTGDDGGSVKPFSYASLGDEGGPAKPYVNCTI